MFSFACRKEEKPRSNATGLSFNRVGMKCLKGRCCQAFLFCECIKANPRSHMIDTASEIDVSAGLRPKKGIRWYHLFIVFAVIDVINSSKLTGDTPNAAHPLSSYLASCSGLLS